MSISYVPVNGMCSSDGSLLALQGLVSDPSLLVPPPISPGKFESNSVGASYIQLTAEAMASIGFAGFSVEGEANVSYFVLDVMPTQTVASTNAASPIATWVYGVGIRIAVRALSLKGSAGASLQAVAASATLTGNGSSFVFEGIGLGFGAMPLLQGLVDQSLSGFTAQTWMEVGNVMNDLTAYIADPSNATELTPQVVGVVFNNGPQVQSAAASSGWALRGITKNYSGQTLASHTPKSLPPGVALDATLVDQIYMEVVGNTSVQPSAASPTAINVAKQLVNAGP